MKKFDSKNNWLIWLVVATAIIAGIGVYWGDNLFGIVSAATGAICVILTAKGYKSTYIFGTINAIMYGLIAYKSKFYGDAMLNLLYYLPMQFVGYAMWKKNMTSTGEVKAKKLNKKEAIIFAAICIVGVMAYALILQSIGGSLPIADSISTVLSILAMILTVKCYREQWVLWIVINITSIIMWTTSIHNGGADYATLAMWCVYLANSIWGYIHWTKLEKTKEKATI